MATASRPVPPARGTGPTSEASSSGSGGSSRRWTPRSPKSRTIRDSAIGGAHREPGRSGREARTGAIGPVTRSSPLRPIAAKLALVVVSLAAVPAVLYQQFLVAEEIGGAVGLERGWNAGLIVLG